MSQGSLNPRIRFLGQKLWSVARVQRNRETEKQRNTKVTTEGTLSGFQEFFLQPIIKDRPNIISSAQLRNAITRIRLSSHRYKIETGRWGKNKIPREARKCTLCDALESEFHVLLKCPRFVNERTGRVPESLIINPCMETFVRLFQCKDPQVLTNLALLVQCQYINFV